ncbi:2OG-Fe(II) oxygenase [Sandarakinorhabdus oryzae]|uniref:2OG-Fe(II) oxygenase n=1 Tax=Sandarakinorhabdus oryzae TaxID=2675220 RepID=UPI0012E0CF62|nr:2OG-Fe(II) oxygenase family protein [Sandarakinorhabdus oryzae]
MSDAPQLFALNPAIDRAAVRAALARDRFVQVEDVLLPDAAETLWSILREATPFGLAWAGEGAPHGQRLRQDQLRQLSPQQKAAMGNGAAAAARAGYFAFLYGQYPLAEAAREQWHPGHPLYQLFEEINGPEALDFARAVSGIPGLTVADAQATLYGPGHFLTEHDDHVEKEGRRLAYVLNLTKDWRADWGGYLNILDARGDIVAGLKPRFNCLNLFTVPLQHNVGVVAQFAPIGRYAITGWFRDF